MTIDVQALCGWIPPENRTREQHEASGQAIQAMPRFAIQGEWREDVTKACLFEVWSHPDVVAALGYAFPGTHQITGSCVGAGGGNALFTLSAVEVVRLGDPERIVIPFWLLPYGKSRQRAGMRGRGEGSMGATFAEAVRQDGVLDANGDGLPKFSRDDGLVWGKSVELEWSDGAAIGEKWLSESRRHLVRTTAQCRTADDVRAAIVNGYPCTCASNWGGQMSPGTSGNPAVLLNRRSGSWSHQMSVQAWWQHPSLGEIFWIHNQWGVNTHGKCPSGAPGGGFWIAKSDMQSICDADEVFAFSGFDGFPSQDISWYI